MLNNKMTICIIGAIICLLLLGSYFYAEDKYNAGYTDGYNAAYSKGYSDGYADRNKLTDNSSVKTETKIVYEKVPYNGESDVQVKTEAPKITLEINGKKQEIVQKEETAQLAVKSSTEVKLKIPERKWTAGIGSDGHGVSYMLKAPIKDAVGVWVAGSTGRDKKVMGGISISF